MNKLDKPRTFYFIIHKGFEKYDVPLLEVAEIKFHYFDGRFYESDSGNKFNKNVIDKVSVFSTYEKAEKVRLKRLNLVREKLASALKSIDEQIPSNVAKYLKS